MVAERKTVSGINREFVLTTDQITRLGVKRSVMIAELGKE